MFRPIKLRHYLMWMQNRGFAPAAVLAGSGLALDMLQDTSCLVSLEQAKTVISNMINLCGSQAIGLEVGQQTEIMDLGLLGHAILSSRTARDAVQFWARYSDVLVGMLIHVHFDERSSTDWSLTLIERTPLGFLYNFCTEESLMMMVRLGGMLSGTRVRLARVDLSYPAPSHYRDYEALFDCPVHFNARSTTIHYSAPDLNVTLRGNDYEFNEFCARQCALVMRQIGTGSPYASRVRAQLLQNPGPRPGIEAVARGLCMSGRSLRRHLREEGQSFQQIVDDYRRDMAREYLCAGNFPPKEIAYLLGFKDINAFRRAFKGWTGQTIAQYREHENSL